jgi:putative protease
MPSIELLAPAGNLEKLKTAVHYGADAVYLSGKSYSLRSYAGNFDLEELREAAGYAHSCGVRVYIAANAFIRPGDSSALHRYLEEIAAIGPDALIIADPGVLAAAKEIAPEISIHLSTQANTTNHLAARFWKSMGVKRINAARELTLSEIRQISEEDASVEIEAFVHGAMCIAYSGRCLLSSYMAGRHGNLGRCAHPCRWRYAVVEEKRPGKYMPVAEDGAGTYIFNSRDLCMIEHIPDMIAAGITSLKIEGRQKGLGYLAAVVKTYREAIDAFCVSAPDFRVKRHWLAELAAVSPRPCTTGFYFNEPDAVIPDYEAGRPPEESRLVGVVRGLTKDGAMEVLMKNRINENDTISILRKNGASALRTVDAITDAEGLRLDTAQAGMDVLLRCPPVEGSRAGDVIRASSPAAFGSLGRKHRTEAQQPSDDEE